MKAIINGKLFDSEKAKRIFTHHQSDYGCRLINGVRGNAEDEININIY
jgi:hypothetical protein